MVFGYFVGTVFCVTGMLLALFPRASLSAANKLRFIPYRPEAAATNRKAGAGLVGLGVIVLLATAFIS